MAVIESTVLDRTLEQRREALARANQIRIHRAELKRQITAGKVRAADVVARPGSELATMKVLDLLLAAPKVGRVKASAWLQRCAISPSKTLAGISDRQRGALVAVLGGSQRVR